MRQTRGGERHRRKNKSENPADAAQRALEEFPGRLALLQILVKRFRHWETPRKRQIRVNLPLTGPAYRLLGLA